MSGRALYVSFQRLTPLRCPSCRALLRSATGLDPAGAVGAPRPGEAITLCTECATWLLFVDGGDGRLALRLATAAERDAAPAGLRAFAEQMVLFRKTRGTPQQ